MISSIAWSVKFLPCLILKSINYKVLQIRADEDINLFHK